MRGYEERKFVLLAIFFFTGITYLFRLFYIQVIDDTYESSARNQSLRYVTQYPVRGLIYDRNEELLVYNEAAYDLMVIPKRVKNLDTLKFCELVNITKKLFLKNMNKATAYSRYKASIFIKQLSADAYASIAEKLYKYPGFFGQERTIRSYPKSIAGHVMGYIGEVNTAVLNRDNSYKIGEYIGINGLERSYEKELRGLPGVQVFLVDVHNTVQGSYKEGENDTLAEAGQDIISTLDAKLQQYGEKLMTNKKGSIVAIEPSTGEILALVSSPGYDPNLLVGRNRGKNYSELAKNDSLVPLFNRALMAKYPPGSIFKMVQALVALQEGVINVNTGLACNKNLVDCHNHPTAVTVEKGIQYSCNPYFYNVFRKMIQQGKKRSIFQDSRIGLEIWRKHMLSFGLGRKLQVDIPNLKAGNIPSVADYDKMHGEGRWAFSTIYSLSIGQGEVEVIPLQMANLAAIVANRGFYFIPHIVKSIGQSGSKRVLYKKKIYTTVDRKYFELCAEAMRKVVEEPGGTARRARIDSITVCGKTGTAQNPHGEDHSVFIAFSPKDNPKIAIAVYVENAGFGGTWAAPIASLMIEKYLTGEINRPEKEQRILEADFINPGK